LGPWIDKVKNSTPTALILIDVQRGEILPGDYGIAHMGGGSRRHQRIRELLAAARLAGVPPVFVQEVHKRSLIDFGRELEGTEGIHCLEGEVATELAEGLSPLEDEYLIRKRRYSAFFATELDLVLRSYGAQTLLLVGSLTDVCVHYTFVDAHQHDYRCRVLADCVGGSSQGAHEAALCAMAYLQRDCLTDSSHVLRGLADGSFASPLPGRLARAGRPLVRAGALL
jgi:nicotinamidase-related amidase